MPGDGLKSESAPSSIEVSASEGYVSAEAEVEVDYGFSDMERAEDELAGDVVAQGVGGGAVARDVEGGTGGE